jgi:hypothetical protein
MPSDEETEPVVFEQKDDGTTHLVGDWPDFAVFDPLVLRSSPFVVLVHDDVLISVANASARYLKRHETITGSWVCVLINGSKHGPEPRDEQGSRQPAPG